MQKYLKKKEQKSDSCSLPFKSKSQINIHHFWVHDGFYWEAEGADTISKQIYFQIHTELHTYLATRWIFLLH